MCRRGAGRWLTGRFRPLCCHWCRSGTLGACIALEHLVNAALDVVGQLIHARFRLANQLRAHLRARAERHGNTHLDRMCAPTGGELRSITQPDIWVIACPARSLRLVDLSIHLIAPTFCSLLKTFRAIRM